MQTGLCHVSPVSAVQKLQVNRDRLTLALILKYPLLQHTSITNKILASHTNWDTGGSQPSESLFNGSNVYILNGYIYLTKSYSHQIYLSSSLMHVVQNLV